VMAGGSRVVRESLQALSAYLAQRQQNASALIGLAADRLQGYAEQSARPDYWQRFVSAEARSIQIDEQSSPPTNERSKP
jgi:dihydroorotate dehydrogenase (NAD+) catalytic subunit